MGQPSAGPRPAVWVAAGLVAGLLAGVVAGLLRAPRPAADGRAAGAAG
ncbi:MAG TPA: hypothetical protein VNU26_17320 [Mycobacteriales bacterium]|nr:hypothetical protein [Mycobacteriales bacterium]